MYSSYTAASFPRAMQLATDHRVNLEGALTWAFEFENEPYFAGFRALSTNQIDLPVLNVFRLFAKLNGQLLPVKSTSAATAGDILQHGVPTDHPDVSAVAAMTGDTITVLLWHYTDDDLPGPAADVELKLSNLTWPGDKIYVRQFRIDEAHGNGYAAWLKMGSPQPPSSGQIRQLQAAAKMDPDSSDPTPIANHTASIHTSLPRHAVALLEMTNR